jgi:hypothetical protein
MRTKGTRGFAGAAVVACGLVAAIAGCGDNAGNPVGYGPEGQPDGAVLITSVVVVSPDTSQVLLIATVLAPPPADAFRLYLNPGNQGYRPASDAAFAPVATLTSGWSVYQSVVDGFDPSVDSEILARGSRNGFETSAAPVSNRGFVPAANPIALARLQPVALFLPGDSTTTTANPTFTWQALPGAVRYIVQVYDLNGNPVYSALVPGATHQLGVGPGTTFQYLPLVNTGLYRWDVQAIDAGSRVYAVSTENRQFFAAVPLP